MGKIITYNMIRDEAVNQLSEVFSVKSNVKIKSHVGIFSEDEMKRVVTEAPAILTGLMSIVDDGPNDVQKIDFVSWVIVRATNQDAIFDNALVLVSFLIPALKNLNTTWSYGGATNIKANNLFSSSQGAVNVSLWAVGWSWLVRDCILTNSIAGITVFESFEPFLGYESNLLVGNHNNISIDDNVNLEE